MPYDHEAYDNAYIASTHVGVQYWTALLAPHSLAVTLRGGIDRDESRIKYTRA